MGNCQAVDAATLIIQHPDGKQEKLYRVVKAGEIIKCNPGHYVALLLSTSYANNSVVRVTRIKLLRPSDTLLLGHAYRLITSQEVMCAKKHKKKHPQNKQPCENERNRGKCCGRTWQPSLNTISES
ncbi:hypothetical protein M5689_017261 [Euphorbia peplus]|nr:hypothetical protein M5689_017261 [Euphorbia peplus]